jgi:hypothetical protein
MDLPGADSVSDEEPQQVTIWLMTDDPTERERLDDQIRALAAELREVSGIESVDRLPGPPAPPGTRTGMVVAGSALVAMIGAYGVVPLVKLLQSWIQVHKDKTIDVTVRKGEVLRLAMKGYSPRASMKALDRLHIYSEPESGGDFTPIDLGDATGG